jgi:small-conductance mechanosensitive channel
MGGAMTLRLALVCLLAALLAVGAGALAARWLPGWLVQIITLALLLIAFVWLQAVL